MKRNHNKYNFFKVDILSTNITKFIKSNTLFIGMNFYSFVIPFSFSLTTFSLNDSSCDLSLQRRVKDALDFHVA